MRRFRAWDHEDADDSPLAFHLSIAGPGPRDISALRGHDGRMKDRILLEGIEMPAALGVSKAERRMRRPVGIELELEVELKRSGRSDRLAHTIDYAEIYGVVEEVAGAHEHRLVEALAERIAGALLSSFPIEACTVTVRKLAPVAGNLKRAGVRIRRSKGTPSTDEGV